MQCTGGSVRTGGVDRAPVLALAGLSQQGALLEHGSITITSESG
jgi:hypothetical protein